MTKDEIIEMAVQCQLVNINNCDGIYMDALQTFAKLVAAKEREACAKVCGDLMFGANPYERLEGMKWCMDRIKARGEA